MTLQKLSRLVEGRWTEHSWAPTFHVQSMASGLDRLVTGAPGDDSVVLRRLVSCLDQPLCILFVLHTSRGEGEPGRYQSPELDKDDLDRLLDDFGPLFSGDARHDLWVHSMPMDATVVWERHNLVYAYGPIEDYRRTLIGIGFERGELQQPSFDHAHHYREELDGLSARLLAALDWRWSPLRPEDVQELD